MTLWSRLRTNHTLTPTGCRNECSQPRKETRGSRSWRKIFKITRISSRSLALASKSWWIRRRGSISHQASFSISRWTATSMLLDKRCIIRRSLTPRSPSHPSQIQKESRRKRRGHRQLAPRSLRSTKSTIFWLSPWKKSQVWWKSHTNRT